MKSFWNVLGQILAVVFVVVFAVLIINANFTFIYNETILKILDIIRTYGSLLLVAVVGFEAMSKSNFIFKLIFIILLAIVIVFMFFPGTYENLIGLVK